MYNNDELKIVISCPLCENKELNVIGGDKNLMQCISCGYSTSDDYIGNFDDNEMYGELDDRMKKWSKEFNGQIWIPSVLNLPIGVYYPLDESDEMKWAFAPIEKIPEENQNQYVRPDGKFYEQKYDIDNQIVFDNFGEGLMEINMIMELRRNKENKSSEVKLPKLKKNE